MPDDFDLDHFDQPAPPAGPPPYLQGLNSPQRAAVEQTDGPVLVLAGAGTGKTRVLTARIAHLIASRRAQPWEILAVTFTNKAAKEMEDRTARLLGRPVTGMALGTFHSISARMLRGWWSKQDPAMAAGADLIGMERNFTILDADDQVRLVKQLLQAEGVDDKRWPGRVMAAIIDKWKNKAWTPDLVPKADQASFANGLAGKIYRDYQERLGVLNACDFGDLLLHMIKALQANPDVLAAYQRRFRYILVDEYQDTNVAQYLWLKLLAQGHKNIACVGDDDQSIYGWRGAEVGNILRFEQDFPGAQVIRLEQNYRSTGHILGAASGLIAANQDRLGKTLWTEAGEGDKVSLHGVWDADEEARQIGDEVEALQTKQVPLGEMAVLVRAGFQTREFEDRFITLGLPYRVIGGPRFYERAEIRDALAYLRVITQPSDDLAFERIINKPKRGLGKATLQKLTDAGRALGLPMIRAARQLAQSGQLAGRAKTTLLALLDDFDRWRSELDQRGPQELIELVLEESGYIDMLRADKSLEAPGRLDNLAEMVDAIGEFDDLGSFLEHVSLVMENSQKAQGDAVTVMTLHAAKGLEFDHIFLPGWEEGLFPNQRAIDEGGLKSLEEERRLAYVGITRAKQRARIYFAGNRRIFGRWQSQLPSRFLDELPKAHVETVSDPGLYGSQGGSAWSNSYQSGDWTSRFDNEEKFGPGWKRAEARGLSPNPFDRGLDRGRGQTLDIKPDRVIVQDSAESLFAIGERVFSDKFGPGTVADMDGNKLTVAFDKAGTKRIVANYVRPLDDA